MYLEVLLCQHFVQQLSAIKSKQTESRNFFLPCVFFGSLVPFGIMIHGVWNQPASKLTNMTTMVVVGNSVWTNIHPYWQQRSRVHEMGVKAFTWMPTLAKYSMYNLPPSRISKAMVKGIWRRHNTQWDINWYGQERFQGSEYFDTKPRQN